MTKPVYAIPGNHDWYDALEGFAATFFEPGAARAAMRARIAADGGVSSTTDAASRSSSRERGLPAPAVRRADRRAARRRSSRCRRLDFVLLAVDTGVLRGVDAEQLTWLRAALEASRGKMVMAVLGHPFFAGGHDVARDDDEFMALRELLRAHGVRVVMAGDTHDLEYYREPVDGDAGAGDRAPLGQRRRRRLSELRDGAGVAGQRRDGATGRTIRASATSSRRSVRYTPWWKWPAWVWTRELRRVAVVGRVAVGDVRLQRRAVLSELRRRHRRSGRTPDHLRPWGIRGPLTWSDFDRSRIDGAAGHQPDGRSNGSCRSEAGRLERL